MDCGQLLSTFTYRIERCSSVFLASKQKTSPLGRSESRRHRVRGRSFLCWHRSEKTSSINVCRAWLDLLKTGNSASELWRMTFWSMKTPTWSRRSRHGLAHNPGDPCVPLLLFVLTNSWQQHANQHRRLAWGNRESQRGKRQHPPHSQPYSKLNLSPSDICIFLPNWSSPFQNSLLQTKVMVRPVCLYSLSCKVNLPPELHATPLLLKHGLARERGVLSSSATRLET